MYLKLLELFFLSHGHRGHHIVHNFPMVNEQYTFQLLSQCYNTQYTVHITMMLRLNMDERDDRRKRFEALRRVVETVAAAHLSANLLRGFSRNAASIKSLDVQTHSH
ncbi:uncharacterized protein [Bemisia tabaci]|uniref:uncharacterized protein n=1 Tax=Bemisia tabaci TaxID=7038 RepID=UPI003B2864FD